MWIIAALGTVILIFFPGRIVFVTRSVVAMWYSASFGIALFATGYEVIAAALASGA